MFEPIYLKKKNIYKEKEQNISIIDDEEKQYEDIVIKKSRWIMLALCFFLGSFGMHKFYSGNKKTGIYYLVFFWTFIPTVLSFVEFIYYIFISEHKLNYLIQNRTKTWSIV